MITNYTVSGMTCDHCVRAVREEITALPGVQSVDVDLASGAVRITSITPLRQSDVAAAVDEAGYALADPS